MINILYYYYCDVIRVMYHSNSLLTTKNEKSKDYCKADLKQRVLFFYNNISAGHTSLLQVYRSLNLKKAGIASRNIVIKNNTRCFKSALQ